MAEGVWLLEPSAENKISDRNVVSVNLRVAKGRDGTTRTTIPLLFEHRRSRFVEAGGHTTKPQEKPCKPGSGPGEDTGDPLA